MPLLQRPVLGSTVQLVHAVSVAGRPWLRDRDAFTEALMLIGAVDPPGREIVDLLARRPDQVHTCEQVASSIDPEAPEAFTNTIHARIKRINQFADAFERQPMIDVHDEGYLMRASVAEVVLDALSDPRS
jgi:hypothetical protein